MANVQLVEVSKLKSAHFNPKSRTEKDMKSLVASISEFGMLYPILVTKKMDVVDGHRRLSAYRALGLDKIEAITVDGDQATLFAQVNSMSKKLSGNQTLEVYLKDPNAIHQRARTVFEEAEEVLGRPMLVRMQKEGLSAATFTGAKRLAVECDQETPAVIRKVVKWLLKHGGSNIVKRALGSGTSPGVIMSAVNADKPLRPKFVQAR